MDISREALPIDQIICGNNAQVLAGFPDKCIDLTVTSPPYDKLRTYNGFEWDFEALAPELFRVTKPGGVVVWVVADATVDGSETGSSFRQALYFMECGFRLHDTMIWVKDGSPFPDKTRYYQNHEYMFVFSKPGMNITFNQISDRRNRKAGQKVTGTDREANGDTRESWGRKNNQVYSDYGPRYNVWECQAVKTKIRESHPAIFPESLAHDHIISWSNPGDIVLDPFIGSGTTAKMAVKTDRHYIGIDISEKYCELARKRVALVKQQPKLFTWDLQPAI